VSAAASSSGGAAPKRQSRKAREQSGAQGPAAKEQQQQPQQQQVAAAAAPQQQQQYLYEGRYGLPVVRRKLGYAELIKAMRLGEVAEVRFFTTHEDATQVGMVFLDVLTLEGCMCRWR
jgi:hypothetical protein